jgi:hypothetical protein
MPESEVSEQETRDEVFVEIVKRQGAEVIKRMGPMPERRAERVKRGAEINLNHDDYYVRITGE